MVTPIQQPIFLRFLLPRSAQCCRHPSSIPLRIPRRLFSQGSPLLTAKKPNKPIVNKSSSHTSNISPPKAVSKILTKSTTPTQSIPSITTPYRSYAAQLASKPSPTLLYESPTPLVHTTVCYLFGGFCIAYGAWNIYAQVLYPLHGLGPFGTSLWAAIGVAMGFFGIWSISGVSSFSSRRVPLLFPTFHSMDFYTPLPFS